MTSKPSESDSNSSKSSRFLSFGEDPRFDKWVELISAVVLALATIATAWCGYQASRWSGEQANHYYLASNARVEAAQASGESLQRASVDVGLFLQWLDAYSQEDTQLQQFLFDRFPVDLKAATEAWIATKPLQNRDAPSSPFAMPGYRQADRDRIAQLEKTADDEFALANSANELGDRYVLLTVMFAGVLFFAGISGKFQSRMVDIGVLVASMLVFLIGLIIVSTFPIK